MPNQNLKSLNEGWRNIHDRLQKLKMPAIHVELLRGVFFAGASFTLEQIEELGQDAVTDEEAIAWRSQADDDIAAVVIDGLFSVTKLPGAKH